MRCPICKSEFVEAMSTALPFCSDRCRTIDLGRWLGETYSLRVVADPEADEAPESQTGVQGDEPSDGIE